SEPSNGSNDDITNSYKGDQTLNVSVGLALQRQMASADNSSGPAAQRKERCMLLSHPQTGPRRNTCPRA
ncbi:hypothetical protein Tco_0430755, partial [Tanacetum coccineum]